MIGLSFGACRSNPRHAARCLRSAFVSGIVVFASGLAVAGDVGSAYQGYPGPRRPDAEVARIELNDADWIRLDDRLITSDEYSRVELLPGEHRVEWGKKFGVSFLVDPSMKADRAARETVVFAANHTYRLGADRSHGPNYQVFLCNEDAGTGEIVAGFKKPSKLRAKQVNPGPYVPPLDTEQLHGKSGARGKYSRDPAVQRFFQAIVSGDLARIEDFVAGGGDLEVRDKDGMTPLLRASLESDRAVVERLMALGADVNARVKRSDRRTGLMIAASLGRGEAVDALLKSPDLDVNAESKEGVTALHFATGNGHQQVADLLRTHPDLAPSDFQRRDELLEQLGDRVWAANIPYKLKDSLVTKVSFAIGAKDGSPARHQMGNFIRKVERARKKTIPDSLADELIAAAEEILALAQSD